MILQNTFKSDERICAIRGGDPFVSVVRPEGIEEDGKCPEGTKPCTERTSAENTVCYPEEEHQLKCPILKIKFEKYEKLGEEIIDTENWERPFEYFTQKKRWIISSRK